VDVRYFVGHEPRLEMNTKVFQKSVIEHSERLKDGFEILPYTTLKEQGYIERDHVGSTKFTLARFLVPHLCGFKGFSVFCDSDMVWTVDPTILERYIQPKYPVMCVKHDINYLLQGPASDKQTQPLAKPRVQEKNSWHTRKWWSSMMIINNEHPAIKALSVDYINTADYNEIMQMRWVTPGDEIGSLPKSFNYLVNYYHDEIHPACIHYTDGTPYYNSHLMMQFKPHYERYIK